MSGKMMLLAATALLINAGSAAAQSYDYEEPAEAPSPYSYAWDEPSMLTRIGVGFTIGAGVAGFAGDRIRDTVDDDVSGMWTARATIGTHIPLGLDVAYVGTSVDITPLGATTTGTLIGTNVEGALRWNILPHYTWNPYVFAGAGWQRYDITDADFSRADTGLEDEDDLAVFPMGVGIAYRDRSGFVGELRGTFRAAADSSLLVDSTGDDASLHTWDATAQLGYEF